MQEPTIYPIRVVSQKRLLPYSVKTIKRLIESGELKAVNTCRGNKNKRYAITTQEIQRFIAALPSSG